MKRLCQTLDVFVDTDDVVTKQVQIESSDGAKVPATLHYSKKVLSDLSAKPQKPMPTLISFYGGYGVSDSDMFDPGKLAIVNNLQGMWV